MVHLNDPTALILTPVLMIEVKSAVKYENTRNVKRDALRKTILDGKEEKDRP